MRVLEFNTEKTWRGGERQTYYNIKGFLKKGIEVDLIALKNSPLARKTLSLGCNIIEVNNNLEALRFLQKFGRNCFVQKWSIRQNITHEEGLERIQ